MKSSTLKPEAKRALRAVGSTWFGPGDIVANDFRRIAAEEDGAGIADLACQALRLGGRDLEMFRREPICERDGLIETIDDDDRAETGPAGARKIGAGQCRELRLDRRRDFAGEGLIVGDEDRLRGGVMLGLGKKVGRQSRTGRCPCRR